MIATQRIISSSMANHGLTQGLRRVDAEDQAAIGEGADLLLWSQSHRYFDEVAMRVPGPLLEIYTSTADRLVVMKGAQMGLSEWAINLALWTADTRYAGRGNALYVLPGGQRAGDFVHARVDLAIASSSYLLTRIRAIALKDPDRVGLKRIGRGYVYFRTSGAQAGLRTVDADTVILDEYDVMEAWVLPMVQHRLGSSRAPLLRILGTPTFPGVGIELEYLGGDQRRYLIACANCGTEQALEWEKTVVIAGDPHDPKCKAARICVDCEDDLAPAIQRAWESGDGGRWVPEAPEHPYPSYQLSRLYRPEAGLTRIARGLAESNEHDVQQTWNQDLATPHAPAGGQLSLEELARLCLYDGTIADLAGRTGAVMGVDVGAKMHCWLMALDENLPLLVGAYELDDFTAVGELMRRFNVRVCVVDAQPESHLVDQFKRRWRGRVWGCLYTPRRWPPRWTTTQDEAGHPVSDPGRRYVVQADRTAAMDSFAALLRGQDTEQFGWQPRMLFPRDAASVAGLFAHLQAPVRRRVEKAGVIRAIWDEGSRPDHYFHAGVYARLAWQIADIELGGSEFYVSGMTKEEIEEFAKRRLDRPPESSEGGFYVSGMSTEEIAEFEARRQARGAGES